MVPRLSKSETSKVSFELFVENVVLPHFKRGLKKGTYQQKKGHCRHIKRYFKGKTFQEIEQKDIANFRSYLMDLKNSHGEPLSSMYLNLVLSTLGQIYDLACEHDVVKENIAQISRGCGK
ncbi:phage integrase SAM-like domain-containing protein [Niallia sp. FSL R7-0271]|uniref:phage integrase SAM-like domain-containing protein n=1 Tax=unclassified Niallia TaxID=2837522 RepID=UPI0030FCF818